MASTTTGRAASVAGGPPPRKRPLLRAGDSLTAYLYLSPAVLLFLVFIAAPLVGAIGLSFYNWDLLGTSTFTGLENYKRLLTDDVALKAIWNTLVFTFWSVVLHLGFGLALALPVNRAMPSALRYFLRTAIFFPFLVSWAAAALIWTYILDPNFGFVTYYLGELGLPSFSFLISPNWAMPSLIFVDLWRTLGFTFIILLAGLQGIPAHLYDAAKVDGAGAFQRFWSVTVPMLSPTLFFATIITFIGAFQVFEPMFIMTNGGPGNSTLSIVMHIYQVGFRQFEMGYAAVLALVVFAVIMLITLVQLALGRYWVHYD